MSVAQAFCNAQVHGVRHKRHAVPHVHLPRHLPPGTPLLPQEHDEWPEFADAVARRHRRYVLTSDNR